jgi:hypothetical protein
MSDVSCSDNLVSCIAFCIGHSSSSSLQCSSSISSPSIGSVSTSSVKSMILWSSLLSSVIFAYPLPDSWSSSACWLAYLSLAIMTSCVVIHIAQASCVRGMSLAYLRHISIDSIIAASDNYHPIFFITLSSHKRRFISTSSDLAYAVPSDETIIGIISTCISQILLVSWAGLLYFSFLSM